MGDDAAVAKDLMGDEFTLVEGLPGAPAPGERTWIRFGGEQLLGSGGCNELEAHWTVEGSRLVLPDGMGTTDMFSGGPTGEADDALGQLLAAKPAITLADDRLRLEAGNTTAVFERTDTLASEWAGLL